MSRVDLTFAGNSRSAVAAARETAASMAKVRSEARGTADDLGKATRGAIAGSGAFRGLGRSIAFASAGFLGGFGLAAAVRGATSELSDSIKVNAQTAAAIKSTGGAANVSAREIDGLAQSLLRKSGIDDEVIKSGENMLLTFTKVRNEAGKGNDIFTQGAKAALDMSVALGTDMRTSALQLGKALQDPVAGVLALRRAGVTFTAEQRQQIKALVDSNRLLDAQKIILREVTKEFGGSAEALGKTMPGQISILRESISNLSADLLRGLTPQIVSGTKAAQEWVDKLQKSGKAQETAKRIGKDLAEIIRDAAAAARVAAKGFDLMSDAVGGDKEALVLLGGAGLAWKVTGAVNTVQGLVAVKRAAEAAAGAEAVAGAAGSRTGLALLLSRLKMLGALGVITIGVEIVINRKRIGAMLSDAVGGGTLGKILAAGTDKGLVDLITGGGGGKESNLSGVPTGFPGVSGGSPTGEKIAKTAVQVGSNKALTYVWGGTSAKTGYDCSGFVYDMYARQGIKIPRTSDTQFYDPNAIEVDYGDLQPGDAVYFVGSNSGANAGRPPRHTGLYIGSGNFIEYFSSGKPAKIAALTSRGDYMGARRWLKIGAQKGAGTDTPKPDNTWSKGVVNTTMTRLDTAVSRAKALTPKNVADDLAALNAERDFVKQVIAHTGGTKALYDQLDQLNNEIAALATDPKKVKVRSGISLVSAGIREALANAAGTKDKGDDLAALKAERAELEKLQDTVKKGTPQYVAISEQLGRVNKQIGAIDATRAKAALAAANAVYKEYARNAAATLKAVAAEWKAHLKELDAAAAAEKKKFDQVLSLDMSHILRDFDRAFSRIKSAFDKETAAGLAALAAPTIAGVVQTPEEKALADFLAQRAADDLAKSRAEQLANSQNPEETAALILGFSLDDQQTALQAAADQSRIAADQATDDAQKAADDKAAAAQQAYQDARDAQWQSLQDINDDQRTALQASLDDWVANINDKKAAWVDFLVWLQANGLGTSGLIDPGDTPAQDYAAAAAAYAGGGAAQSFGFGGQLGPYIGTLPGYATGGVVGMPRPRTVDPRDTILVRARPGETIRTPEQEAALWGRGGQVVGDVYLDGKKVGIHVAPHVTNAQERQIGYPSPRG